MDYRWKIFDGDNIFCLYFLAFLVQTINQKNEKISFNLFGYESDH